MSKDDTGCKLAPVYKHKERKPKKPHYIPRPWGKPYNYKCFQCPFTCMEKSHLYNHMKYSLCKNSLSLLIESDWPYKKGNLLHPELRFLQAAEASRARGRQGEPEAGDSAAGAAGLRRGVEREGAADGPAGADGAGKAGDEAHLFQEEEEEEDDEETSGLFTETDVGEKKEKAKEADSAAREPREVDVNALLLRFKSKRDQPCKEPPPDFIITDVFSLKKHVVKGKEPPEPEPEPKPKPCRGPKRCPGNGALLMEQWKLVANGQRRAAGGTEVPSPCPGGSIIPCYPPPAYGEFHEPQSLNLSLLGINYPLSPNLFSYLGPSVASGATPQPHLAQLPFLASTAQLMHPHTAHFQPLQSPERPNLLPRFYYPLLFEHSFGAAENKMAAGKPEAPQPQPQQPPAAAAGPVGSQAKTPPEPAHKPGLLKVPVLKAGLPWAKGFHEELPPEQGRGATLRLEEGEKWPGKKPAVAGAYHQLVGMKDGAPLAPSSLGKAGVPTLACSDGGPHALHDLKRRFPGGGLDFVGSGVLSPRKAKCQASHLRPPPTQPPRALDHWHVELHACSPEDPQKANGSDVVSPTTPDPNHPFPKPSQEQTPPLGPRGPEEATTVLIEDLSKTLEEYQAVEKKLSDLAKEDSPAQKQLRGQLVKIRQELFHIHEALEKATRATEGPLDLSVKKASRGPLEEGHQEPKVAPPSKCGKGQGKDAEPVRRCSATGQDESQGEEAPNCLLESEDNKTIDLLIKMSRSESLRAACAEAHLGAVIKAEVLPLGAPLELRHALEPYYSRTTKCEADSSVLLGADGRPHPAQGPPLPGPEDLPLGPRGALPRPLPCGLPGGETEGVCLHSPLSTDPRLAESP